MSAKEFNWSGKKFDGKGADTWLQEFQLTAMAFGLSDKETYIAMLKNLEVSIVTRLMAELKEAGTFPKEEGRTGEWLTKTLTERYGPRGAP